MRHDFLNSYLERDKPDYRTYCSCRVFVQWSTACFCCNSNIRGT